MGRYKDGKLTETVLFQKQLENGNWADITGEEDLEAFHTDTNADTEKLIETLAFNN